MAKDEYRFGKGYGAALKATYLALPDENGLDPFHVVFSTMEVIRFFLCMSCLLARRLFHQGWHSLIKDDTTSLEYLPEEITVGFALQNMAYAHGTPLADYLCDRVNNLAVNHIYQTMVQRLNDRHAGTPRARPLPLECPFPFASEGPIDIVVEAIQIPTRAGPPRYFATRIVQCKRPKLFEKVWVHPFTHPGQGANRDDPGLPEMDMGGKDRQQTNAKGGRTLPSGLEELANDGEISDKNGRPGSSASIEYVIDEVRFPGISEIKPEASEKALQQYRNVARKGSKQTLEGMSTDSPGSTKDVAQAEVISRPVDEEEKAREDEFHWLMACIPNLRALGLDAHLMQKVELLKVKERLTGESIRTATWSAYSKASRVIRTRHLGAVALQLANATVLVMEIEKRRQELSFAGVVVPQEFALERFLEIVAENVVERQGWPGLIREGGGYGLFVLDTGTEKIFCRGALKNHVGLDGPESYARKIEDSFASPKARQILLQAGN